MIVAASTVVISPMTVTQIRPRERHAGVAATPLGDYLALEYPVITHHLALTRSSSG